MGYSDAFYEAVGAVHMHSDFSDGSLPIPAIAGIAAQKPLDFLMFSDHNTLEPKRRGYEGWHGDVLVLIGYEINDPDDRNHYLAFQLEHEIPSGLRAAEYVRQVREAGGFGIIAHPAEKRGFSDAYPPYPWTDWDAVGFDGIEIWNQLSEWIEGVTKRNIWWRILHPLRSIRFPVWETLDRWDHLNQARRVVGIGGIDVHAFQIKLLGLIPVEIYPYKVQFRSIRTHILTEKPLMDEQKGKLSFSEAEAELFGSLRKGHCFIVNNALGDGRGFRFRAKTEEGELIMGDRTTQGSSVRFEVSTPQKALIRLLRDGKVIQSSLTETMSHNTTESGVYRVEVFRRRKGWIYSNPIVVESAGEP